MARTIRWQIHFADIEDNHYVINIYDEGFNGEVTQLTGGPEPFITQEDADDDPFLPVRGQTGYLSFYDETGTMADAVRATSTFSRYVELTRSSAVVWCGYIAVAEYTGEWGPSPTLVRLPIVSTLEVLKEVPYTATGAIKSLGQILGEAVSAAGTAVGTITHAKNTSANCLSATVCDLIFSTRPSSEDNIRYRGINPNLQAPDTFYSCYQVIEEICMYFGWSARDHGLYIDLCATDNTKEYHVHAVSALVAGNTNPQYDSAGAVMDMPQITSADNTRSMLSSKSQIRLTVNCAPYNIDMLGTDDIDKLEFAQYYDTTYSSLPASPVWYADIFDEDSYTKTYQYATNDEGSPTTSKVDKYMIASNINDRKLEDMWTQGGQLAKDIYTYKGKKTREKTISLSVSCAEQPESRPMGWLAAEFLSRDLYVLTNENAYLSLEFDLSLMFYDPSIEDDGIKNPDDKNAEPETPRYTTGVIKHQLCFERTDGATLYYNNFDSDGNLTANGVWTTDVSYFGVDVIEAVFSPQYSTTGITKGLPIRMPSGSGRFRLRIYTQEPYCSTSWATLLPLVKYLRYENLKLKLASSESYQRNHKYIDTGEIRLNALTGATNTMEVYERKSLLIANSYGFNFCYGRVSGGTDPAQSLLNRMAAWFGTPRYMAEVSMRSYDLPSHNTMSVNGIEYLIGAKTHNWRDMDIKAKLYKK